MVYSAKIDVEVLFSCIFLWFYTTCTFSLNENASLETAISMQVNDMCGMGTPIESDDVESMEAFSVPFF